MNAPYESVDALVGYSGFVGSNLRRQHDFQALYNSKNVEDIRGNSFRLLVHAGTQAQKWWANQNPREDWRSIEAALGPLSEARAEHLVLISTIDVLPLVARADEQFDPGSKNNHAYGANRLKLEEQLAERFTRITIARLPALFGRGLKKNVIYDLMHNNMLEKINPKSSFQYYDLERLWSDLGIAIAADLDLIHLVTEPVATGDILARFFAGKVVGADPAPEIHYDFRTRHSELFGGDGGYICDRDQTLGALGAYLDWDRENCSKVLG